MATPKVLLHGAGAIGTVYLYLLQHAGCEVTAVCRSNYEAVSRHGFAIDSEKFGMGINVRPTHIVRSPAEAVAYGPFDYVVVATKALPESKTPETIALAVTEGRTCIVLMQNGVGIEHEYAERFPSSPILSGVIYLPVTQTSPGRVQMGMAELLEIGTFPATAYTSSIDAKSAADGFVEAIKRGGGNVRLMKDVQEQRWRKLIINASWNPICALTVSRDVAFLSSSDSAQQIVFDVMLEVVSVAQALGYNNITPAIAEKQIGIATARMGGKGIEPSMLADVVNGRRMEVEVILGNAVRAARDLGVKVPRLDTLYALSKALDQALALRKPGQSLTGDELRAKV